MSKVGKEDSVCREKSVKDWIRMASMPTSRGEPVVNEHDAPVRLLVKSPNYL